MSWLSGTSFPGGSMKWAAHAPATASPGAQHPERKGTGESRGWIQQHSTWEAAAPSTPTPRDTGEQKGKTQQRQK